MHTIDWESFIVKKVRTLDDVQKLIRLTLLHIEIFTVGIFTVYKKWTCYIMVLQL